jgi:dienelactone hydrolase
MFRETKERFIIGLLCLICMFTSYQAIKYRRALWGKPPLSWTKFWEKAAPDPISLPYFDNPQVKISEAYFSKPKLLTFQANSPKEAITWKKELRNKLLELMGFSREAHKPLQPELLEKVDLGDVVREKVSYEGYHSRIVAFVFIPKTKEEKSFPAVAVFPGHGKGVIETTGIIGGSYQHSNALEISRRGYITITPENVNFGMRASNHKITTNLGILHGKPIQGLYLFEGMRTVDYLCQREEVDATRIGAAGVSLGGEISLFVSAIDERIKSCVSSCNLITYEHMLLKNNCPCYLIPGILKYAEIRDIAALIAPRALNFQIGSGDYYFPPDIAMREFKRIKKAYKVYGAEDKVKLSLFEGGHEFGVENALNWLNKTL